MPRQVEIFVNRAEAGGSHLRAEAADTDQFQQVVVLLAVSSRDLDERVLDRPFREASIRHVGRGSGTCRTTASGRPANEAARESSAGEGEHPQMTGRAQSTGTCARPAAARGRTRAGTSARRRRARSRRARTPSRSCESRNGSAWPSAWRKCRFRRSRSCASLYAGIAKAVDQIDRRDRVGLFGKGKRHPAAAAAGVQHPAAHRLSYRSQMSQDFRAAVGPRTGRNRTRCGSGGRRGAESACRQSRALTNPSLPCPTIHCNAGAFIGTVHAGPRPGKRWQRLRFGDERRPIGARGGFRYRECMQDSPSGIRLQDVEDHRALVAEPRRLMYVNTYSMSGRSARSA